MRVFVCLSIVALLTGLAYGQSTDNPASFDVADVHAVVEHGSQQYARGGAMRGGRFEMRTATMVELISTAYGVDADKILGGPNWLELDRFDVIARTQSGATADTMKIMLRNLLADRFRLKLHQDTQPMPAWALTAGKRPQLKKSEGEADAGCRMIMPGRGGAAPPTPGQPMQAPLFTYDCHNMTMAALAEEMRGMIAAGRYLDGNPVVDKTGLEGAWDFSFKYSPNIMRINGVEIPSVSMQEAMEKQLGLKLEATKAPLPVIVVDSVNRTPSANEPGVAGKLKGSEPPTEFEVADVKPSDPDSPGMNFNIQPGGGVHLRGVTLKFLIQQAWNVSDDTLVGAPKWLDTDRFDIVAKAPVTMLPSGRATAPEIDFDAALVMLRNLVIERFKLVTHTEQRPVTAYTLRAVKPKMKKADPASRIRYKEGPATSDGKDPRKANAVLSRLVTVQNMTMAQFAEKLQSIAPGYIKSPVLDATGLEGGWDFTLSFSAAGQLRQAGRGGGGRGGEGAAGPPGEAADPTGAVSLFEAIEKQLGLKLEQEKRPVEVLVIDRIEQKPTDN